MLLKVTEVGDFLLIYVSTPVKVCAACDRKGLYAKACAANNDKYLDLVARTWPGRCHAGPFSQYAFLLPLETAADHAVPMPVRPIHGHYGSAQGHRGVRWGGPDPAGTNLSSGKRSARRTCYSPAAGVAGYLRSR